MPFGLAQGNPEDKEKKIGVRLPQLYFASRLTFVLLAGEGFVDSSDSGIMRFATQCR